MTTSYHQLTLDVLENDALMIAASLEGFGAPAPQSVTARRMGRNVPWRVEAIFDTPPDSDALKAFLADIAPGSAAEIAPLKDEDWVALSQSQLPPIRTRRFYLRGPHVPLPSDLGARHVLTIEAGMAFGTGHHASTHGCLLMLDALKDQRFAPRRVLDLGAGTAVLAVAAHKLWPAALILASDIDPVAVEVARENGRLNAAPGIRHIVAPGFKHAALREGAYDLVLANILAPPLKQLARDVARHAAARARVILSGILDEQAPSVAAFYRAAGFRLLKRRDLDGWATLLLQKERATSRAMAASLSQPFWMDER